MNRLEIIQICRDALGDDMLDGEFTNAQIVRAINIAQKEVTDEFFQYAPYLFWGSDTITTEAGTHLYTRPSGLTYNPLHLKIVTGSSNDYILDAIDRGIPNPSDTADIATGYLFFGNNIWIYPTPTTVRTYTIYGKYYPADLSADETECTLPEPLHSALAYKSALMLAGGRGNDYGNVGYISKMYNSCIEAFIPTVRTASMRDYYGMGGSINSITFNGQVSRL